MTSFKQVFFINLRHKPLASLLFAAGFVLSPITASAYDFKDSTGTIDFSIGGFAKLSALYTDTDSGSIDGGSGPTGIGRSFYLPSATPVGTGESKKVLDVSARESRFNFKAKSTVDEHKLGMVLEMDFLTTSEGNEVVTNSSAPRMRHYFFTFDNWLFGQTWTTFMDTGALPDTVDFLAATDSTVFIRQAQVRYSSGNFQIALENPETYSRISGANDISDDNTLPDIAANYKFSGDWGHLRLNGLVRQLKIDDGTYDSVATGYGAGISGKLKIATADDFRFSVHYGDGMGRYTSLGLVYDAIVDTGTGELETVKSTTAFAAYRHVWSSKSRSNLILSSAQIDNPSVADGATSESSSSVQINVLYTPIKQVTYGVMLLTAKRETENGDDGKLNRLQAMAMYAF